MEDSKAGLERAYVATLDVRMREMESGEEKRRSSISTNASHKAYATGRRYPMRWTSADIARYAAYYQSNITTVAWPFRDIQANFDMYLEAVPFRGFEWHIRYLFKYATTMHKKDKMVEAIVRRRVVLDRAMMMELLWGCSAGVLCRNALAISKLYDEFWEVSGIAYLWLMTGQGRMLRRGEVYVWDDTLGSHYIPLMNAFVRLVHDKCKYNLPDAFCRDAVQEILKLRDDPQYDFRRKRKAYINKKKLELAEEQEQEPMEDELVTDATADVSDTNVDAVADTSVDPDADTPDAMEEDAQAAEAEEEELLLDDTI